jgi:hypothetical protein
MDEETKQRLDRIEQKADEIFKSAEKTRKYFLAVLIVTLIAFVVPLIGLVFAIPSYLSTYNELLEM